MKNSGDVAGRERAGHDHVEAIAEADHGNRVDPLINPGATQTATFKNLPQAAFVSRTTLEVDVQPVKGETNPNNNSASYPVIFSFG